MLHHIRKHTFNKIKDKNESTPLFNLNLISKAEYTRRSKVQSYSIFIYANTAFKY